jgi:hypothetical protein
MVNPDRHILNPDRHILNPASPDSVNQESPSPVNLDTDRANPLEVTHSLANLDSDNHNPGMGGNLDRGATHNLVSLGSLSPVNPGMDNQGSHSPAMDNHSPGLDNHSLGMANQAMGGNRIQWLG